MKNLARYAISIAAAAFFAGCAGSQLPQMSAFASPPGDQYLAQGEKSGRGSQKIKHVVIIVQMDRSFNNLFYGYPGAKTATYGYDSKGRKVRLKPVSLATKWRIKPNFYAVCNGTGSIPGTDCRMNGFDREKWTCGKPGEVRCPIKYPPYAYVPHDEIKPYFEMAKQYVVADEMFAANFDGGSFESLQYIIAAQDDGTVGSPSGLPGCGGGPHDWIKTIGDVRQRGKRVHPCFDYTTLGDELDAANLSWAYYQSGGSDGICGADNNSDRRPDDSSYAFWSAYWAIKHICYGPDWKKDIISPETQFLSDVKAGNLRTVSWITPSFEDSDEPGNDSTTGPSWVASLVDAVGESKYWDSTAIFVFWDGFGGWFDPVAPEYVDDDGLGIRVPMLIISPYAKQAYVSHVHYEHGSILRFVEDDFGLPQLSESDMRASSPARDCFNFNQAPREFVPIKAP